MASKIPKTPTSSKLTDIYSSNSFYFEPIIREETHQQILLLDENKAKGIVNSSADCLVLVR